MIKCDTGRLSDFHKNLLDILNSIGRSAKDIAKEIGVSESTIRDSWLARGKYPPADKIIKLLELSGKKSWDLFPGEKPQEPAITPTIKSSAEIELMQKLIKSLEEHKTRLEIAYETLKKENDDLKAKLQPVKIPWAGEERRSAK